MKRVDEYQRDVVMMSKINESDQRTEKLKRDKVCFPNVTEARLLHPVAVCVVFVCVCCGFVC
jgi:hypothetical protein